LKDAADYTRAAPAAPIVNGEQIPERERILGAFVRGATRRP
jgi:hypothetical protein